ncbi:MAG: hypothetical protein IKP65_02470 [Alphaproteobacteria bacterium]|nr:hypothetical protein [Alphaproteobacteria bacterium]
MSTNFYINTKDKGELHIGKHSIGWYFILHIYPEKNINELIDWIGEFYNGKIFNEYGLSITADEMIEIILNNQIGKKNDESKIPKYGSSSPEIECIYGEKGLKRIAKQKEGAMGLYSLETIEFC